MMIGFCGGVGSSVGCCLLFAALCGLEIYCLYWYLLLLHSGGPEMNVFLMCCLSDMDGIGKRGVFIVGCGHVCDGIILCVES